jgi:hypothetical protein
MRRKKSEEITIQGEAVFRFCSSKIGDKHGEQFFPRLLNWSWSELLSLADFERVCAGFRVVISVVSEKDARVGFIHIPVVWGLTLDTFRLKVKDRIRSIREGRAVSPGEHDQDILFGPSTAPNSFKRSLDALHDLMGFLSSDSGVCPLAG